MARRGTYLFVAILVTAVSGLAGVASAQEGQPMEDMLRPYLDPGFFPQEGPDTDKDFINAGVAAIREALPAMSPYIAGARPKVLVLTQGTYGPLHVPGAAGLLVLLREAARRYDAFELTELYSDESIDAEMLEGYDVVVLNHVGRTRRPEVFNEILPAWVRGGGGLVGIHSAALLFKDQPDAEYNRLLGAYVDTVNTQYGHPGGHGGSFPVVLPQPEDPLVRAFHGEPTERTVRHRYLRGSERRGYDVTIRPPVELADELYALVPAPGLQTRPEVLVQIDNEAATQRYPEGADNFTYALNWVQPYGQGRVFYTQFGHNLAVYSVPCVAQGILDGVLYAAGAEQQPTTNAADGPGDGTGQ